MLYRRLRMTRIVLAYCGYVLASAALSPLAAAAETSYYGQKAVQEITSRIAQKDCTGAVGDLKSALKKGFPEVALLAGSMYENGICVARDWERAVPFYIQAWQGGVSDGADRLAAGYAAPGNGPDVAAALWWASRERDKAGKMHGVAGCLPGADAVDDMDRFVTALQAWPQARLAACNYMIGVMSTISAEAKYPAMAYIYAVGGDVTVRFLPAVPRIDTQKGETREYAMMGAINAEKTQDRGTRSVGEFERMVRALADRALRRYPQPAGIAADTLVQTEYHFGIQYE